MRVTTGGCTETWRNAISDGYASYGEDSFAFELPEIKNWWSRGFVRLNATCLRSGSMQLTRSGGKSLKCEKAGEVKAWPEGLKVRCWDPAQVCRIKAWQRLRCHAAGGCTLPDSVDSGDDPHEP